MLLIIRPYGDWIKEHIMAIFDAAGLSTGKIMAINEPTTIPEVVHEVENTRYDALLIPFHVKDGRNGIQVLKALQESDAITPRVPIVMPISLFAALAFRGALAKEDQEFKSWFENHVCVLNGPFEEHEPHVLGLRNYLARITS